MSEGTLPAIKRPLLKPTVHTVVIGVIGLILAASQLAPAQNPSQPKRGFYPAGSYALSEIESISTTQGNLILRIPLASLPAGRGGVAAGVGLFYNSKAYETFSYQDSRYEDGSSSTELRASDAGGWRYGFRYDVQVIDRFSENPVRNIPCHSHEMNYRWKVKVKFPDGSEHIFRPSGDTDPLGDNFFNIEPDGWLTVGCGQADQNVRPNGMTYYSADGTFIRLQFGPDGGDHNWTNNTWTLYLPDGTRVTGGLGPQRIYDRNNNSVEIRNITYNGHPASEIIDDLGRHIIVEYDHTTGRDYVRAWQNENGELKELVWTITNGGASASDRSYYLNPNDIAFGGAMFGPGYAVVRRIDLPQQTGGLSYNFTYNSDDPGFGWGELATLTLPSGAQVNYEFSTFSFTSLAVDVLRNFVSQKQIVYQAEYDSASTQVTDTWQYSLTETESVITAPDQGVTREYFPQTNVETWDSGLVYRTENPDGSIVERIWQQNVPFGYGTSSQRANPYVKSEFTSIKNATGSLTSTAIKTHTLDKNGNTTQTVEYDWVPYSNVARAGDGKPTGAIPASAQVKRISSTAFYNPTPVADSTAFDADIYTQGSSKQFRQAALSAEVSNNVKTLSRIEFFYDDPDDTANLTKKTSWDSTKGVYSNPLTTNNSLSVTTTYNNYGSPLLVTNATGVKTEFTYGAVGEFADLYPTQIKTAFGTPIERTEQREYDFHSGLVTRVIDVDNEVSAVTTYDIFGRPTLVRNAEDKPEETRTATEYSEPLRRVIVRSDLNTAGDGKLVSVQHYDQLGRIRLTRELEDASTQSATDEKTGIKVQTRYLFSGATSLMLTSNPYRAATSDAATGEAEMGWTRRKSDNGGRIIEVQSFTGASLPAPWDDNTTSSGIIVSSYNANFITETDQAGKTHRSMLDALGRLVRVDEPNASNNLGTTSAPTQPTSYGYDALDNLVSITQGTQPRTFVYDSLKRLTSATNPESGTLDYEYDQNGNLTARVDPRRLPTSSTRIRTTYVYDPLNRVLSRTYNDGTPGVTFKYDVYDTVTENNPNASGRLTKISSTVSSCTYDEYDALGRVKKGAQLTDGQAYKFTYDYNLAGSVVSQKYPSGRIVKTDYDAAGRISGVKNNDGNYYAGAAPADANRIRYSTGGAIQLMKLGNGLWEHTNFNSRLQPIQIGLGSTGSTSNILQLDYAYGTTNNNGNLQSHTITVPTVGTISGFTATQTYTYDSLDRLAVAEENNGNSWRQKFDYDRHGNRKFLSGTTLPGLLTAENNPIINPNNNRIDETKSGQTNVLYDEAGSLTRGVDGHTYQYDAENKMVSFDGGATASGGASYSYDGEGRRVKKVVGGPQSATTVFVYDIKSRLVAEYADVAPTQSGVSYITIDTVGSPRVITGANQQVLGRHDYLPFGEELFAGTGGRTGQDNQNYGADKLRQKFTSKERDAETSLDYFIARYYSSLQGRFTGVDPHNPILESGDESKFVAYLAQPQKWNRYTYAVGNPLKYVDPTGEDIVLTGTEEEQKQARDRLQLMLGDERFQLVDYSQEYIEGLGNVTVVKFGTDQNKAKFQAIGGNNPDESEFSSTMADIIGSKEHVEFRIATKYKMKGTVLGIPAKVTNQTEDDGGAATISKYDSLTGNVQIFVHPQASILATKKSASEHKRGFSRANDGGSLTYTPQQVDAHEFGHAWVRLKVFGQGGNTDDKALRMENIMRIRQSSPNRRTSH